MARKLGIKGRPLDLQTPEWEPLIEIADLHVEDFMWMYAVELRDKTRIQVYKHYWTRQSLHLDGDGRCFAYCETDRYQEIDVEWALSRALDEDILCREELAGWCMSEPEPDQIEIHWACPAEEIAIQRERIEHVIRHCGLQYVDHANQGAVAPGVRRITFLGDDADGVRLKVAAVDVPERGFLVVQASEIQGPDGLYGRAKRWRR
jgi:hypothetical protein